MTTTERETMTEPAQAVELFHADGRPAGIYYCSGCRLTLRKASDVELCCARKCSYCRAPLGSERRGWHACKFCAVVREEQSRRERLEKAKKLESWDGWVFWGGHGMNEGYFENLEALHEWHEEQIADGEKVSPLPEFVHVCKTEPFRGLDIDDLIERCTEDSFDGAADQITGREELEAACKAFNAANVGLVSYTPDWGRVVRVLAVAP